MLRNYNFHRSCWRYKNGKVHSDESHPCFFCGHELPMKDAAQTECKECGIIVCPNCHNCMCTISDMEYQTLERIHNMYCKHLYKWDGSIYLNPRVPFSQNIVAQCEKTLQRCYELEVKNGTI